MAEKIPLNFYRRVSKKLKRVPESVYTTPSNRASTIISSIGSNTTNENQYVNLSLSSTNTGEGFVTLQDIPLQPLEYTNLLPSKLVLAEGDEVVASADIEDLANINDLGLFWLYDLPTTLTNVSLQTEFTNSTQITADFGIGNIPNNQRFFNSTFEDWTGFIESFPGSNTTREYNVSGDPIVNVSNIQGPAGYVMGYEINSIGVVPPISGTVSIKKQTSTLEEYQLFNSNNYPRVQLTNIDPRALQPVNPTLQLNNTQQWNGVGILLRGSVTDSITNNSTNPLFVNLGSDLFGKQIKVTAWMRASSATKVVIEAPMTANTIGNEIVGASYAANYGTINNYTIVSLTSSWQKYEALFTYPTFDEYWLSAHDWVLNQTYSQRQLSGGFTTYTYPSANITYKNVVPLSAYIAGVSFRFRYPYLNTYRRRVGDSVASTNHLISSISQTNILNGYYDIANLEVFVNTGTNFLPLSSLVPVSYTYDLSNDTNTNLTLSILESINTQ